MSFGTTNQLYNFSSLLTELKDKEYMRIRKYTDVSNGNKHEKHLMMFNRQEFDELTLEEKEKARWFRSVIFSPELNQIIAYSPPKSYSTEEFIARNGDDFKNVMTATEFIDGTMITAYFDRILNKWCIASRSVFNANTKFHTTQRYTYGNIFHWFDQQFFGGHLLRNLDANLCYNFVIQRKDIRHIMPCYEPKIYCVGIYKCYPNNSVYAYNQIEIRNEIDTVNMAIANTLGTFERIIDLPFVIQTEHIKDFVASMTITQEEFEKNEIKENTKRFAGLMLYDNQGRRMKFLSIMFESLKTLKGNHSAVLDRFREFNAIEDQKKKDDLYKLYFHYFPENYYIYRNMWIGGWW